VYYDDDVINNGKSLTITPQSDQQPDTWWGPRPEGQSQTHPTQQELYECQQIALELHWTNYKLQNGITNETDESAENDYDSSVPT